MENPSEYVVCLKRKSIYFPKSVFEDTKLVELDGKKFPVPVDTDTYLRAITGQTI